MSWLPHVLFIHFISVPSAVEINGFVWNGGPQFRIHWFLPCYHHFPGKIAISEISAVSQFDHTSMSIVHCFNAYCWWLKRHVSWLNPYDFAFSYLVSYFWPVSYVRLLCCFRWFPPSLSAPPLWGWSRARSIWAVIKTRPTVLSKTVPVFPTDFPWIVIHFECCSCGQGTCKNLWRTSIISIHIARTILFATVLFDSPFCFIHLIFQPANDVDVYNNLGSYLSLWPFENGWNGASENGWSTQWQLVCKTVTIAMAGPSPINIWDTLWLCQNSHWKSPI